MRFKSHLTEAILLKRMFKFMALVALPNGRQMVVRCPSLGPLTGCTLLGSRVWFSKPLPPPVEYLHTWELVEVDGGHLVAVNGEHTRPLILEAIRQEVIETLKGYQVIHTNAHPNVIQGHNLPLDVLLKKNNEQCFMHVQLVTGAHESQTGVFPETTNPAGLQHLQRLIAIKQNGHRALLCFCVQHSGLQQIAIHEHRDSVYSRLLHHAINIGVEVMAYKTSITLKHMTLDTAIPILVNRNLALPGPD